MATHIRRREFRVALSGTVALPFMARVSNVVTLTSFLLLLCGCIALGITSPSSATEELRIGMIVPVTGPFAQVGKDMADGLNMYLEEMNSDFAGAKVKLIIGSLREEVPCQVRQDTVVFL